MKFICESATVTTQRMRTYLRRNRIDVLLLLLVLIVSLTACSQSQGLPETSGASTSDNQEWECQEIFLEDGIPYSMDSRGTASSLATLFNHRLNGKIKTWEGETKQRP